VRRLTALRHSVARITALAEEILQANTAEEAEALAARGLTEALGLSGVRVILREQASGPAADAIRGGRPIEPAGLRTLYLPMLPGAHPAGALELNWTGNKCPLQTDERTALAHLANQIAITLELHDRRFQREQVLRGEKLGAAGRLIAAVARDLAEPLSAASDVARSLPASPQSQSIIASVAGARQTLDRLLALGQNQFATLSPFDAAAVVVGLADFRRRSWEMRGIEVTLDLSRQPLPVYGLRGAFEHALLDILVHAEQAAESSGRGFSVATGCDGPAADISITHPAAAEIDFGDLLDLATSAMETCGGRAGVERVGQEAKWRISAPMRGQGISAAPMEPAVVKCRPLTLLLVDPHPATHRVFLEKLAQRGHRVVPAAGGGEAIEMAGAVHFDAVLAVPGLPDMDWPELAERTRPAGCRTILLCDSLAPLSHALVQRGEVLALKRPVDETELDRVLLSAGQSG